MPKQEASKEEPLEEVYKNPEFSKAADALVGRIVAYRGGNNLPTDKEAVVAVAVRILEERLK